MSSIEPVNSPYVYGIDLGTSNSAIAVSANGRVTVLPVDGRKSLPSAVSFRPDGEVVVGLQAKRRAIMDPTNSVLSVKRHIADDGWSIESGGTKYSATDISEKILGRLIAAAEAEAPFDLLGTPSKVVICVPANFTENQKRETMRAAENANLLVMQLLEEPVAAAIAYALERDRDQTILVYDLGGGTFDISILEVKSGAGTPASLRVLAKEGIAELGGNDFDRDLMNLAATQLLEKSGIDIFDIKKDQEVSEKALREAHLKMQEACESAKIALSESTAATITIPDILKDGSGTLHSVDIEVTRDEFNAAIRSKIDDTVAAVNRALAAAAIGIGDVSRIVLVGGSTRIPLVRETLIAAFGKEPYGDLDPDTVVAHGAALFAADLDVVGERKIDILDKVTHNLGIAVAGNRFSLIIPKNSDIPEEGVFSQTREYATQRDNQTELVVRIYQSDEVVEILGDETKYVGEFFLSGIPPMPAGREIVTVTFEIDRQNLLRVRAVASGQEGELEIRR